MCYALLRFLEYIYIYDSIEFILPRILSVHHCVFILYLNYLIGYIFVRLYFLFIVTVIFRISRDFNIVSFVFNPSKIVIHVLSSFPTVKSTFDSILHYNFTICPQKFFVYNLTTLRFVLKSFLFTVTVSVEKEIYSYLWMS